VRLKKKRKRKEEWHEGYERDESSERKIKSARKDVTLLRDETFFFQPCAIQQRGRHQCLVVTIFFCPCTCPPF
jgi:hypothetical protein